MSGEVAVSEEMLSRRDLKASSSFFWRAASSAATRSAMWRSRVLAREELVWNKFSIKMALSREMQIGLNAICAVEACEERINVLQRRLAMSRLVVAKIVQASYCEEMLSASIKPLLRS